MEEGFQMLLPTISLMPDLMPSFLRPVPQKFNRKEHLSLHFRSVLYYYVDPWVLYLNYKYRKECRPLSVKADDELRHPQIYPASASVLYHHQDEQCLYINKVPHLTGK